MYELAELEAFGREAEERKYPGIGVGGVIVPGDLAVANKHPGEYEDSHERITEARARQEARSRRRRQAQATQAAKTAASCEAAHSIERRVIEQDLDELRGYHPRAQVTGSSSGGIIVSVPVRLFESLPYRARLVMEVPSTTRVQRLRPPLPPVYPFDVDERPEGRLIAPLVPDVRIWAVWDDGVVLVSHHQYPDQSICAFTPGEWLLGLHALHDLAGIAITWIGKLLHEQLIGFWPGRQHIVALAMRLRDRPDEFCGCGTWKRYRECCRSMVEAASPYDLARDAFRGREQYLYELRWQGRAPAPPFNFLGGASYAAFEFSWLKAPWCASSPHGGLDGPVQPDLFQFTIGQASSA